MTWVPRLRPADAARVALLHTLTPAQQRELARLVSTGACGLPVDAGRLRELGLTFRGKKPQHLAALPSEAEIELELESWERNGWRFLTAHHEDFPHSLHEIPDPPLHLFAHGTLRVATDSRPRIAIVGSRAASAAGTRIARELARDLSLAGCVVISGLARGIDVAAHRGALAAGGDTVAVLGTGLDRVYPQEHSAVAEEIVGQGLLVTEFAPGTPPLPLHFPQRNRILTGLADALVVVEGSERSGARSSVDHALDQGREVLAVPRDPLHEGSRLPNRLLREGAFPLVSARDVLELLDSSAVCRNRRRIAAVAGAATRGLSLATAGATDLGPAEDRGATEDRGPGEDRGATEDLGPAEDRSATDRGPVGDCGVAEGRRAARAGRDGCTAAKLGSAADRPTAGAVPLADAVRALIARRPGRSVDEIAAELEPAPLRDLLHCLTALEMEGRLVRRPGARWFPPASPNPRFGS